MTAPDTQAQDDTRTLAQQIRELAAELRDHPNQYRAAQVSLLLFELADDAAETELRADRAENARDQVREMLHTAQAECGELARALRVERLRSQSAEKLLAEATRGSDFPFVPLRDAQSDAESPATPPKAKGAGDSGNGPQRGAGDVGTVERLSNAPKSPSEIAVGDTVWSGGTWFTVASVEQWDNWFQFSNAQGATSTWSADQAVYVRDPQPDGPPICPDCGMPETNCCCG